MIALAAGLRVYLACRSMDNDVHNQRLGRHAAINRSCRRFSSDNSLRTASAGVPWAPCHPHPQLCGCDIKLLGAHFVSIWRMPRWNESGGGSGANSSPVPW
jgi:hypothetical protein